LDDVKKFFRTYYAPNNATLTIAGDFEPTKARALIKQYFADVPRGPKMPPRPKVPAVVLSKDTFLVMEDRVQLPRAFYNWPTVKLFASDDAALDVLASVLASGKNSRLYKKLVYETQVAQTVRASQQSSKLAGFFQIDITPKPGQNLTSIDRVVQEELQRLMNEPITLRELARVQNSFRSSFLNRMASVQNKADILNSYNYMAGTPDFIQQDAARYERVTLAEVQRATRLYLGKPKVVLTVVPEGKREMMLTANGGTR
jgi:zinc protease